MSYSKKFWPELNKLSINKKEETGMCASIIISIIAILLSAGSLTVAIIQYYTERQRNRNESTIHAFDDLEANVFLEADYKKTINTLSKDQIINEKDMVKASPYLSRIEHFCVGINTETYDISTLNRMAGGFFIEQYNLWEKIINAKREEESSIKMQHYNEFEDVVEILKKQRDNRKFDITKNKD